MAEHLRLEPTVSATVAWEEADTWKSPVHHDTAKHAIVGQVTNPEHHLPGEETHEIVF